ncbi:MAG: hypothetical protein AB7U23_16395 [Dehalococcoidia bacterium]
MSDVDDLRAEIARGHSAVRQAIEFAAPTWERPRAARSGEDEVWSPRRTAEHVIAVETSTWAAIARALGGSLVRPEPLQLPDADAALPTLQHATAVADDVPEAVTDDNLGAPADAWGEVAGAMKFTAWHLLTHARQITGVDQR